MLGFLVLRKGNDTGIWLGFLVLRERNDTGIWLGFLAFFFVKEMTLAFCSAFFLLLACLPYLKEMKEMDETVATTTVIVKFPSSQTGGNEEEEKKKKNPPPFGRGACGDDGDGDGDGWMDFVTAIRCF